MSDQDLSNKFVSKLFSVEMLVITCGIVASYTTLAIGQDSQGNKIKAIEKEQVEINNTVQSIQTDTAILRNEQQHIKDDLKEQNQDIKLILQILQKR